jgi:hypothetical protein
MKARKLEGCLKTAIRTIENNRIRRLVLQFETALKKEECTKTDLKSPVKAAMPSNAWHKRAGLDLMLFEN